MKRLFAAIKIQPDEHFLQVFGHLRQALGRERIKWVDPNQLHLTLKFFGETPVEMIPGISRVLKDAGTGTGAIELQISGTGIFGSRYDPRVVWFGVQPSENLQELYRRIHQGLIPLGYEPDRQNFVPHLTLGRIRGIQNKKVFQQTMDKEKERFIQHVTADAFHLFESRLFSTGAEYTVCESYGLTLPV